MQLARVDTAVVSLPCCLPSPLHRSLDCLVNNAGFHPPIAPVDSMHTPGSYAYNVRARVARAPRRRSSCFVPRAEMYDVLRVNLVAPWVLCKAALPHLRATQGSIVNIASVSGYFGQIGSAGYCATKGTVHSCTDCYLVA